LNLTQRGLQEGNYGSRYIRERLQES